MIYLDNSATTKPFPEVLESFHKVSAEFFGNPSSLHRFGSQAENLLRQSRMQVSNLLQVLPEEIVFTSGGSEGNNLAIKGAALANQARGKHIITTAIEHPSVSEACKQLELTGFSVTYLPVNKQGIVEIHDVINAIKEDTILISIMHVNNEVGSIQPIEEIGLLLKNYQKIIYHVDNVQGIGKVPLNISKANIDLCTMSAHKFNGLKGNGILFVRKGLRLSPLIAGGDQEMRFRSGTENVAGIVAMTKALRLTSEGYASNYKRVKAIKDEIMSELKEINGISVHTPSEKSAPHIINFSINGLKSEVFVHLLEEEDIFVSTTSACSSKKKVPSKTLLAMGLDKSQVDSAIRISLSADNELFQVPVIIDAIKRSLKKLEKVMR